jgi:hypothetical protein
VKIFLVFLYNKDMKRNKKRHKSRKAQNASGKMQCPICKEQHFLTTHHIHGRKIPDYNHESNLADICENCHRKVHEGVIIIEGWFLTTEGNELIWHEVGEISLSGNDAIPYIIQRNTPDKEYKEYKEYKEGKDSQ